MNIHIRKLPTFALYAAQADEFGLTVFGACEDEALNKLAEEIRGREAARPLVPEKGRGGRHAAV